MSRNSPSMKTAGRRGYPAVRPLPDPRQRAGRHLEDLRGRPRSRPAASPTAPTGRWPARSSWPTRPRRPGSRARTNSLGSNYEYIGRLFDKGLGRKIYKRDLTMSDADCNLDYLMTEQIIAGDVDEVLAAAAGADRRDRPVRHAGPDELRLGRQGELAAQHGAVRQGADAGVEQGGRRRGGVSDRASAKRLAAWRRSMSPPESAKADAPACHTYRPEPTADQPTLASPAGHLPPWTVGESAAAAGPRLAQLDQADRARRAVGRRVDRHRANGCSARRSARNTAARCCGWPA